MFVVATCLLAGLVRRHHLRGRGWVATIGLWWWRVVDWVVDASMERSQAVHSPSGRQATVAASRACGIAPNANCYVLRAPALPQDRWSGGMGLWNGPVVSWQFPTTPAIIYGRAKANGFPENYTQTSFPVMQIRHTCCLCCCGFLCSSWSGRR